jgi:hypothetical protein
MKVILVDNYARDHIPDKLLASFLTKEDAELLANNYNDESRDDELWAVVVEDNHKLSRGMEDLV